MRISRTTPGILSRSLLAAVAFVALFAAMFALDPVPRASAHAAYVDSTPAFAEVLDAPPSAITLRFSQELFRRTGANTVSLSRVEDSAAVAIPLGPAQIDNADRHVMSVQLPNSLEVGRYRVSWTNLSSEDGDADAGWYHFYVGREPTPSEVAEDRAQSQALLVSYPGDESDDGAEAEAAAPPAVNVVRGDDPDVGGVGAAAVIWLAVGVVAGVALSVALGRHGARRVRTSA